MQDLAIPIGSFLDNWIYPTYEKHNTIEWRLSDDAQHEILNADYSIDALTTRQRNGVKRLIPMMGDNIYVALSGGADSQATCLLLLYAGVKFTVAILEFTHGLNSNDTISARSFCDLHKLPFVIISFNVINYLTRNLREQVDLYKCPSPQLTCHCVFYKILMDTYSPSTIIAGGNPPSIREGDWKFISNRSHSVWITFANKHKFPIIGNFLGYSLDIALPFMCMQPDSPSAELEAPIRYDAKICGMHRLGLDVIPQKQKYNGFELVKEHFSGLTNDGWFFEKAFRLPNHSTIPEYSSIFDISCEIEDKLNIEHYKLNNK